MEPVDTPPCRLVDRPARNRSARFRGLLSASPAARSRRYGRGRRPDTAEFRPPKRANWPPVRRGADGAVARLATPPPRGGGAPAVAQRRALQRRRGAIAPMQVGARRVQARRRCGRATMHGRTGAWPTVDAPRCCRPNRRRSRGPPRMGPPIQTVKLGLQHRHFLNVGTDDPSIAACAAIASSRRGLRPEARCDASNQALAPSFGRRRGIGRICEPGAAAPRPATRLHRGRRPRQRKEASAIRPIEFAGRRDSTRIARPRVLKAVDAAGIAARSAVRRQGRPCRRWRDPSSVYRITRPGGRTPPRDRTRRPHGPTPPRDRLELTDDRQAPVRPSEYPQGFPRPKASRRSRFDNRSLTDREQTRIA